MSSLTPRKQLVLTLTSCSEVERMDREPDVQALLANVWPKRGLPSSGLSFRAELHPASAPLHQHQWVDKLW